MNKFDIGDKVVYSEIIDRSLVKNVGLVKCYSVSVFAEIVNDVIRKDIKVQYLINNRWYIEDFVEEYLSEIR